MQRTELGFNLFSWGTLLKIILVAGLLTAGLSAGSKAQDKGQKTFPSVEEASHALVAAIQRNDEKAILDVLGPDAKQVVFSGDDVEDRLSRAKFVQEYTEMHRMVTEPDGTVTLYIGAQNWPTPIPLVRKEKAWYFDTEAGKKEILFRRIGRNEISTIHVCRELVAAEKEYYSTHSNEYAQKILSDEGQQNGLYWRVADSEPLSPIGPLVASAVAEGYTRHKDSAPTPYRGYYYRTLTRQGENNSGGPKNYIVNGKMTEGFAFVAYPAEYRSSGVMTFLVSIDGIVYEKDLGKKTAAIAATIEEYYPDASWRKADDQSAEPSGE